MVRIASDRGFGTSSASAQQPPPAVQWISPYAYEDDVSASGTYYDWSWTLNFEYAPGLFGNRWVPTPQTPQPQGEQEREDSGEEWFYGHCNAYEQGQQVGYFTTGYATWPNCYWKGEGCTRTFQQLLTGSDEGSNAPRPGELESPNHRKGDSRGVVARIDKDGHDLWYRFLFTGEVWNVIQDANGDVIVSGYASMCKWPDNEPGDNTRIRFNDAQGVDMNQFDCNNFTTPNRSFGYLAKLDPDDGHVIWCTMAVAETALPAAYEIASGFIDVAEVQTMTGTEYWAVGYSTSSDFGWPPNPYVARFAEDGTYLGGKQFDPAITDPIDWPVNAGRAQFNAIDFDPISENVLVAGYYTTMEQEPWRAMLGMISTTNTDLELVWLRDCGNASDPTNIGTGQLYDRTSYTSGGGFVSDPSTHIVWPVLANFGVGDEIYGGPKTANLFVHGLDLSGNITWTTDLGEVRAYDLQSDITVTTDNKVAIVSTKAGEDDDGNFQWSDIPTVIQDCIQDDFGYDPEGSAGPTDWTTTSNYRYWNTDAYVAKLDPADGTMIWDHTWDADPWTDFECSPGDLRNQECMYKITEAEDGGLVISGNTSHNFDDYYFVKLQSDCQSNLEYDFEISGALDTDHTYTVGAYESWTSDKSIYGIITIPDDHTLTITGCTIRFADSEQLAWPTYVVVQEGGTLILENTTLTSVDGCPNSTWDGVLVQGDESESQLWQPGGERQGKLLMRGSTIRNSRMGAVAANEFFEPPLAPQPGARSGGIIQAYDCQFINNRYDVAFSPYENHGVILTEEIWPNLSYFTRCAFSTAGDMPVEGDRPIDHVFLSGVRRIAFQGCIWKNNLMTSEPFELPSDLG